MSGEREIIKMSVPFQAVMAATDQKILDDEQRIIEGYASTETVDREYEIVTREALKEAAQKYMMFPTIRYMHQKQPIGKALDLKIDHKGLRLKAKILKGIKAADEAWQLVKEGILKAYSIGGRILEAERYYDKTLGRPVRRITKMELYEVSLVDVPANPETLIEVLSKSLDSFEKPEVVKETSQETVKAGSSCRDRYVNPDGTFKNGFDGCVEYFMRCRGLKKENAQRLCAYIGRRAGKIKAVDPDVEKELVDFILFKEVEETSQQQEQQEGGEETETEESNLEERIKTIEERLAKIEEVLRDLWQEKQEQAEAAQAQADVTPVTIKSLIEKTVEEKLKELPVRKAVKENAAPEQEEKTPKEESILKMALKKRFGVDE